MKWFLLPLYGEYAEQVCEHPGVNPVELFARKNCLIIEYRYYKSVPNMGAVELSPDLTEFRTGNGILIFYNFPESGRFQEHSGE